MMGRSLPAFVPARGLQIFVMPLNTPKIYGHIGPHEFQSVDVAGFHLPSFRRCWRPFPTLDECLIAPRERSNQSKV